LNRYVQLACLPDPRLAGFPTKYGETVWAVGFGTLKFMGDSAEVLQNVNFTLYNGAIQCSQVAPEAAKDWNSQICAGTKSGFYYCFILIKEKYKICSLSFHR
jgi:hypothetical protein